MKRILLSVCLVLLTVTAAQAAEITPIRSVVDLATGESRTVTLTDGTTLTVELRALDTTTDPFRGAVRSVRVTLAVNGVEGVIEACNYNLPVRVGPAQVDCPIARPYYETTSNDTWALTDSADARIRLWPAGSPWIRPGTFAYPVRQRWFANPTQMCNEPVYVDGGEIPGNRSVYYHNGLDAGGAEGMVDVLSATDALVVQVGEQVLEGHDPETSPTAPRYDVIYTVDDRGWYYRYSHLKSFETNVRVGERVKMGRKLGELGKEGGSGGWSHFHFCAYAMQPSGKWGTEEAYPYYWQSYVAEYTPAVIAVARPHIVASAGEPVTLDASRSKSTKNERLSYRWMLSDGSESNGVAATITYDTPVVYSEAVLVRDGSGGYAYDIATVNVFDPDDPEVIPPTIHVAYSPTFGIRAGDPVTFKVRVFRSPRGGETWNFGDNSPPVVTTSKPAGANVSVHDPGGYAVVVHRFAKPGDYLVRAEHIHPETGLKAVGMVWVPVE